MNCDEFQQQFQRFLDRRDTRANDQMQEHADQCEPCQQQLRLWQTIETSLASQTTGHKNTTSSKPVGHRSIVAVAMAVAACLAIAFAMPPTGDSALDSQGLTSIDSQPIQTKPTIPDIGPQVSPSMWWNSVRDRDWVNREWVGRTLPTVRIVSDGVAPLGPFDPACCDAANDCPPASNAAARNIAGTNFVNVNQRFIGKRPCHMRSFMDLISRFGDSHGSENFLTRTVASVKTANKLAVLQVTILSICLLTQVASAEQVFQLRNGMVLRGSKAQIASLKEGFGAAAANQVNVRPIWLIDDGLRRQYIHGKSMVVAPPVQQPNLAQSIKIWQPKPLGGKLVAGLGNILAISPFNEFGRRELRMSGPKGPVHVIQGIRELNPRYARLIALKPAQGQPTLLWDMRVATSSLPSSSLNQVFANRIDRTDLSGRLEVVRFYIAAGRFADAKDALKETIRDFPGEKSLEKQLIGLTQRQASQLLDEAEMRAKSGQYQLAKRILQNFPTDDVGRITRLKVQDAIADLLQKEKTSQELVLQLRDQISGLPKGQAAKIASIVDEIEKGLSADTLVRLSDYTRLKDAEAIAIEDRVALAISGWLLGSGSGVQNLAIAASLGQVRDLVAEYLSGVDAPRREAILVALKNLEGALPEYVDRMLPLLEPTLSWPSDSENADIEGFFRIETDRARYLVQLPPEYNPLRSYPCVIALHAAGGDPHDQIDWWSGIYDSDSKARLGHAARNGFVVVAPLWSRDTQRSYEYTPAEHERVLIAMRDAMRRCSIDSDRVFIAGHGEGATAAWDIALAHPDLWAGMISISATPDKTIHHYEPNARFVPMYLLMGELDGNVDAGASAILDDYMSFHHDALVIMYRGRGREFFYDEIPRLFEWMNTSQHVRRPMPREFELNTMRRGDQFFWWLELGELKSGVDMNPILWEKASRIRSGTVAGSIGTGNQIRVSKAPSDQIRLGLRPMEAIDMAQQIVVRYGTRPTYHDFDGDLKTMLEDTRRRADRKRAFWMQIDLP